MFIGGMLFLMSLRSGPHLPISVELPTVKRASDMIVNDLSPLAEMRPEMRTMRLEY